MSVENKTAKEIAEDHKTEEQITGDVGNHPIKNYHFTERDFKEFCKQYGKEIKRRCTDTVQECSTQRQKELILNAELPEIE